MSRQEMARMVELSISERPGAAGVLADKLIDLLPGALQDLVVEGRC